jgi:hypothetical protein
VRIGLCRALSIFMRVPRGNMCVDIVTGPKHGAGYWTEELSWLSGIPISSSTLTEGSLESPIDLRTLLGSLIESVN